MRVGILTGGGDCPGLNAVIRAFVLHGTAQFQFEVTGFLDGWKGILEGRSRPLGPEDVRDIVSVGGTMLGTSRTNPAKREGGFAAVEERWRSAGLEALVAVGGDDTLGVANKLSGMGLPVIGVPKTIDNDLSATDYTFGFDSAVNVAMDAVDRLRTTARSHHRVLVCEVMGRYAGWIAAHVGLAAGAHVTLLPEYDIDLSDVTGKVQRRREAGLGYSLIVVAEGAKRPSGDGGDIATLGEKKDAFGHVQLGGIGEWLAKAVEEETGAETRSVVLGHVQRGGSPTAFDRVLGTRFGYAAAELAARREGGRMVALRGTDIVAVPLAEGVSSLKTVGEDLYRVVQGLET
jgi:phosphofructokinase-like protein